MSRVFVNPLTELAEYEELNRDLNRGKGPVQISGCMDSQKVHLMWEAGETLPWKLVVTYDDSRARRFTRISGALQMQSGCIRPRTFFFIMQISTAT